MTTYPMEHFKGQLPWHVRTKNGQYNKSDELRGPRGSPEKLSDWATTQNDLITNSELGRSQR